MINEFEAQCRARHEAGKPDLKGGRIFHVASGHRRLHNCRGAFAAQGRGCLFKSARDFVAIEAERQAAHPAKSGLSRARRIPDHAPTCLGSKG